MIKEIQKLNIGVEEEYQLIDPKTKELLLQELRTKYKVTISGPNTLSALLQSYHLFQNSTELDILYYWLLKNNCEISNR